MIPLQLRLTNFLSYQEASLDFKGLHTACVCGANGAGKSSLLEAITWGVWGKSRVGSEDDIIHSGEKSVRVDFVLESNGQVYRIIRTRQQGRSATLDFQVQTEEGHFRAIGERKIRATQDQIIQTLKLDYDTFINSAYLRQGRADEFMLRKASDRKQVLAELLKLDRYEVLATRAKDKVKQYKGQIDQLERSLTPLEAKLGTVTPLEERQGEIRQNIAQLQTVQEKEKQELQQLQSLQYNRSAWEEKLRWQQDQYRNLTQDCDRIQQEIIRLQQEKQGWMNLLNRREEIISRYQTLQQQQQQEKEWNEKLHRHQMLQEEKQNLQQQLTHTRYEMSQDLNRLLTQLEQLQKQEQDCQKTLNQSANIQENFAKLQEYRQKVQAFDQLHIQVTPLIQQRNTIIQNIGNAEAKIHARITQCQTRQQELSLSLNQVPLWRQQILEVEAKVAEISKKEVYQKRVETKGKDEGAALNRLEEQECSYQRELQKLQQKLDQLQEPHAVCPLCDRPLDEHYQSLVVDKTHNEQEDIHQQIWNIRQDKAKCERKLQELRQEYAQLSKDIKRKNSLLQERGQLEAQLERSGDDYERKQEIELELERLQESLNTGEYAFELHSQLQALDQQIAAYNYNEKTHALLREEERRLGWAEKQYTLLEDAQKRYNQIQAQKPQLQTSIKEKEEQLNTLQTHSPLQQKFVQIEEQITTLGYSRREHQALQQQLKSPQVQIWQQDYFNLQQAEGQKSQQEEKIRERETLLQVRRKDRDRTKQELDESVKKMQEHPDHSAEIKRLDRSIQQRRYQLDQLISEQGRLQQQLTEIAETKTRYQQTKEELQEIRRKSRIHQELAQAFGKNGIQALMIENILPQLEAATNQFLARLTGNQLHVQFLTQKATKQTSKKKTPKMIDTLDILIADARGTRPYETYSGGEAFRINFSIRLALAQLLAQRSGASLQLLIIDEGFGTQDGEGCDRLIAAINAISADFACILTVTHITHFKEAFQYRIEVSKTEEGSQVQVTG